MGWPGLGQGIGSVLESDLGQMAHFDSVCCTFEEVNLSLQVFHWKNLWCSWVLVQQVVGAAPWAGMVEGHQCQFLAMREDEVDAQDFHKDFVEAVDLAPIAAVEGRMHPSVSKPQEVGCEWADQLDMEGLKASRDRFHCNEDRLLEDILDPLDRVVQDTEDVGAGNVVVQRDCCSALQDSPDLDRVLVQVSEGQHSRKDLMGGNHLNTVSEMGYIRHGHLDNLQA